MTSLNHWQFDWARSRYGLEIKKLTNKQMWEVDDLKEVMASNLLKKVSDSKVKERAIIFIKKHKAGLIKPAKLEEKIMITTPAKKNKHPHLNAAQKREVKQLYAQNLTYQQIADKMGIGYWQASHLLKRKGTRTRGPYNKAPKTVAPVVQETSDNSLTWKQKYLKAISLLVEHDIIEVTL